MSAYAVCMQRGIPATDEDKQTFLDVLADTGVIQDGCRVAKVSRQTVYQWRKNDEVFEQAYADALNAASDALESEARRRAVEGVVRVKFNKEGTPFDEVQYSDTLLLALLKAKKPSEFADRSKTEISGPEGAPIQTNDTAAAARLVALLEEAKLRRQQQQQQDKEVDDLLS